MPVLCAFCSVHLFVDQVPVSLEPLLIVVLPLSTEADVGRCGRPTAMRCFSNPPAGRPWARLAGDSITLQRVWKSIPRWLAHPLKGWEMRRYCRPPFYWSLRTWNNWDGKRMACRWDSSPDPGWKVGRHMSLKLPVGPNAERFCWISLLFRSPPIHFLFFLSFISLSHPPPPLPSIPSDDCFQKKTCFVDVLICVVFFFPLKKIYLFA